MCSYLRHCRSCLTDASFDVSRTIVLTYSAAGSDASSISRASTDSSQQRQSQDSVRPQDIVRTPISPNPPLTPTAEGRFNSLRSILRDGHTPATGQSVRFFSRDAYKIITPDVSAASASGSEPSPASFAARVKPMSSTPVRPPLQDVFSPSQPFAFKPLPPTDDSNIFDLSQDIDLPPIPISKDSRPLLDSAIEIPFDADTEGRQEVEGEFRSSTPSKHDRSQSFSFGQTVFHSLGGGARDSPVSNASSSSRSSRRGSLKPKGNRNRAYSDTVFHSIIQGSPSIALKEVSPEADIDDRSSSALVLYPSPPSPEKEKDPFGTHATAYYTPGTGVPPTPPQAVASHGRKVSREEDLILSLRTQLTLQTELCAQYEVDLRGKDEMMRMLQSRYDERERECEHKKQVIRSWRKRVVELERCCKSLQDQVDQSREESFERSVMDEASNQALRTLHRRIEELEREKSTLERRERSTTEELTVARAALDGAQDELSRRDEAERELQDGIARAREQMESMDVSMMSMEDGDRSRAFSIQSKTAVWDEERKALTATNEAMRAEQLHLETQLADAREEVLNKDNELGVLKAEVEAQWLSTEVQTEKIAQLEKEREELRAEVEALNARTGEMEVEWTQGENRKNELEAEVQELCGEREELEKERSEVSSFDQSEWKRGADISTQLEEQLRAEEEHAGELTIALREREDKVTALEQEHKFALDRATRVESRLREREAELSELVRKQEERENESEMAQSEVTKMKREHARIVNEQSRTLQDVVAREVEARAAMEAMVREKAESDVQLNSLKERTGALTAEVERLRRQVHDLQQESADKEVKLVQVAKQRAQDKEDLNGLNIALDSKQQELELVSPTQCLLYVMDAETVIQLKRRIGVRGTAGGTPAPASKVHASRRESSIFGTPSVATRPPSVLSDTGSTTRERRGSETPSTISKPTLQKSIRANGPASTTTSSMAAKRPSGVMGPPSSLGRSQSANATVSATPTRIPSGSSARATPSTIKAPGPGHARRMSASVLDSSKLRASTSSADKLKKLERLPSVSSASEPDEKENSAPSSTSSTGSASTPSTVKATRRMSAMPA